VNTPEGLTIREGLNLAGSSDPGWTAVGDEAERLSRLRVSGAEKECCLIRKGLPGTAGRGPACPVVWEPGGQPSRRPDCAPDMGVN
jgi:hypothetical protein